MSFAEGYDAAAKDDAAEFKRLDAEVARLRAAMAEIKLRTAAYADAEDWPLVSGVHAVAREALRQREVKEDCMNEAWTACATLDARGNPVIALRLKDGAVVCLHPDIARRFALQISVALGDTEDQ